MKYRYVTIAQQNMIAPEKIPNITLYKPLSISFIFFVVLVSFVELILSIERVCSFLCPEEQTKQQEKG